MEYVFPLAHSVLPEWSNRNVSPFIKMELLYHVHGNKYSIILIFLEIFIRENKGSWRKYTENTETITVAQFILLLSSCLLSKICI